MTKYCGVDRTFSPAFTRETNYARLKISRSSPHFAKQKFDCYGSESTALHLGKKSTIQYNMHLGGPLVETNSASIRFSLQRFVFAVNLLAFRGTLAMCPWVQWSVFREEAISKKGGLCNTLQDRRPAHDVIFSGSPPRTKRCSTRAAAKRQTRLSWRRRVQRYWTKQFSVHNKWRTSFPRASSRRCTRAHATKLT